MDKPLQRGEREVSDIEQIKMFLNSERSDCFHRGHASLEPLLLKAIDALELVCKRNDIPDALLDYLEEHIEHESCFCLPDWDIKNKKEYLRGEAEVKVFIHNRVIDSLQ